MSHTGGGPPSPPIEPAAPSFASPRASRPSPATTPSGPSSPPGARSFLAGARRSPSAVTFSIPASAVSPGRFAPRPPPLRDLASLPPPSDPQVISPNCLASGPARCTTMQLPISRALPQRRR
nr:hypothetical protein SEVIR_5G154100v2 [Setaria viridis]